MKRKLLGFLLFVFMIFLLIACSGQEEDASLSMKMDNTAEEKQASLNMDETVSEPLVVEEKQPGDSKQLTEGEITNSERMVIHNAELELQVQNYSKAQTELETKATEYEGYVVESSTSRYDNEQLTGTMIFRIPEAKFFSFLQDVESAATKVVNRHISGQDVTEEYIDLESRLRSKKAVEARLLGFMEKAEKTEDLLEISSALAQVQEEIEQLSGRVNFLRNQTEFSTVTIVMDETKIDVPAIDHQDLNTWQKVKKQFVLNINLFISFLSGSIVFILGNLPMILLVGMVIWVIFILTRKHKQKKKEE